MANPFDDITEGQLTELLQAAYGGDRAENRRFAQAMQDETAGKHGITARGLRARLVAQGRLTARRETSLATLQSASAVQR